MSGRVRIGSLCTGAAGLDMAVEAVFDAVTVWQSELDPAASRVLAYRCPAVPNLGDLTTVDWAAVPPIDILSAGYPCQPDSLAGKGLSEDDHRWIWPDIARAVSVLRPRLIVLENVAGHFVRGFRTVLGSLTELGYDTQWTLVRASDVGAPHRRERLFVVATDTRDERHERAGGARVGRSGSPNGRQPAAQSDGFTGGASEGQRRGPGEATGAGPAGFDSGRGLFSADPDSDAIRNQPVSFTRRSGTPVAGRSDATAANSARDGRDEGRPESAGLVGGPDAALSGAAPTDADVWRREIGAELDRDTAPDTADRDTRRGHADGHPRTNWGAYETAIRRWERTLGRPAPAPTERNTRGGQRLSPAFVEWLMGWPAGWVTDVPNVSRNDQLKICGNGVVPQQAAHALRALLTVDASLAVSA